MEASAAVDIRRFEPVVARVVATQKFKSLLAVDDDDLRNECRLRAWQAVTKLRLARNGPVDALEELKYVKISLKNYLRDLGRRVRVRERLDIFEGQGREIGFSGGEDDEDGLELVVLDSRPTPDIVAAAHHDRSKVHVAAVRKLKANLGSRELAVLERRGLHEEPYAKDGRSAFVRAKQAARRVLGVRALDDLEPLDLEQYMTIAIEDMNADDLARVLLTHKMPVDTLDKGILVAAVTKLNTEPDTKEVIEFPPCFGTAEYDPKDDLCVKDCDFNGECAVVRGAHVGKGPLFRADIEEKLVQIRSPRSAAADEAPPPKAAKPTKKAVVIHENGKPPKLVKLPPVAPAPETYSPVVGDVLKRNDEREGKVLVQIVGLTATHAEIQNLKALERKPTKVSVDVLGTDLSKGYTFVEHRDELPFEEEMETLKIVVKGSTVTSTVTPTPRVRAAPKNGADEPIVALSDRRGVFRDGRKSYKTREDGSRWYRPPQGSAAELAMKPVGAVVERKFQGHLYRVKKVEDGVTAGTPEAPRKRDGKWTIFAIFVIDVEGKVDKTGKLSPKADKLLDYTGSLNQVAFAITGTNTWSGAKFFNVLPPQLDPHSDEYDPAAFTPTPVYRYGEK